MVWIRVIKLGVISVYMVFKILILDEIIKGVNGNRKEKWFNDWVFVYVKMLGRRNRISKREWEKVFSEVF